MRLQLGQEKMNKINNYNGDKYRIWYSVGTQRRFPLGRSSWSKVERLNEGSGWILSDWCEYSEAEGNTVSLCGFGVYSDKVWGVCVTWIIYKENEIRQLNGDQLL